MMFKKLAVGLAAAALSVTLAACTTGQPAGDPGAATKPTESKELTVVSHDSFTLSDELKKKFETDTGYTVKYVVPGDAGTMVNQLVLTKGSPLGDVVFGIDNTFAGRAVSEQVLAPYTSAKVPQDAGPLAGDVAGSLTPIDFGDVCVNADKKWFADKNLPLPETLDDLAKPEYKDLLVVQNPASSSPGLAFLIATVGAKGDGYLDYWKQLKANGVKVAKGWTEAYNVDFSAGEGNGPRPLVVSYSTSPSYHVDGDASQTTALLGSCFRQVEYAGVIAGAKNEVGAQKYIDFLLSPEVQAEIPTKMYMYPVDRTTKLPDEWVKFAPLAPEPLGVSPTEIGTKRETWIRAWTDEMVG